MSRNPTQHRPNKATRHAAVHRLTIAARNAADWLCDCTPGTHQWELGYEIKSALVGSGNVEKRSLKSNKARCDYSKDFQPKIATAQH